MLFSTETSSNQSSWAHSPKDLFSPCDFTLFFSFDSKEVDSWAFINLLKNNIFLNIVLLSIFVCLYILYFVATYVPLQHLNYYKARITSSSLCAYSSWLSTLHLGSKLPFHLSPMRLAVDQKEGNKVWTWSELVWRDR